MFHVPGFLLYVFAHHIYVWVSAEPRRYAPRLLFHSPLKAAPHTWEVCFEDEWDKPYTRTQAAFPAPWVKANKFWPTVGRVDNVHGDRNLVSCCAWCWWWRWWYGCSG